MASKSIWVLFKFAKLIKNIIKFERLIFNFRTKRYYIKTINIAYFTDGFVFTCEIKWWFAWSTMELSPLFSEEERIKVSSELFNVFNSGLNVVEDTLFSFCSSYGEKIIGKRIKEKKS